MDKDTTLSSKEKAMIVHTYKIRTFLVEFGKRRKERKGWRSFNVNPHVNNLITLTTYLGRHIEQVNEDFFHNLAMAIAYGAVLVRVQDEKILASQEILNAASVADSLLEYSSKIYDHLLLGVKGTYGDDE